MENLTVELPAVDADVNLRFPGGQEVIIRSRPSNADEGTAGSLDFCLPDGCAVSLWSGNKFAYGGVPELNKIVVELPGDDEWEWKEDDE